MNDAHMEEEYIDLGELFHALLRRIHILILAAAVLGAAGFVYSRFFVKPLYNASALMFVNSGSRNNEYVSTDELRSSASLVDTYSIIIKSDTVLGEVFNDLGMLEGTDGVYTTGIYPKGISSISVESVNATQVMKVTVTATSPEEALDVCREITKVSPEVIIDTVAAGSVRVLSEASTSGIRISPSIRKYTLLGALLGFVLAAGVIALIAILGNKIKNENDVKKLDLPVLGVIPLYETERK